MNNVKQRLEQVKHRILCAAGEVTQYKNWSDEYSRKTMNIACNPERDTFFQAIDPFTISELKTLSVEDLYSEGFGNWDGKLVLIPIWLKNFIQPDEMVTSINGKEETISAADNDNRAGYLAYGFYKDQE